MTEEEMEELKWEMRQEMLQEIYEENQMRSDMEYAMAKLGLDYIFEQCTELADKLGDYGYDVSVYDVIGYLEEL